MRVFSCAACWLLLVATCMAGLTVSGVKAFAPPLVSSTASSAMHAELARSGAALAPRMSSHHATSSTSIAAARSAAAAARKANASAALRTITARLSTEPARATWSAPPAITTAMPMIEKKASKSGGGAAVLERPKPLAAPAAEKVMPSPEDKFKVMLFNDNGNTREFVARSLVQVVGMTEGDAFNIMTMAHKNGMALVGIWHLELAEGYCDQLKSRGLVAEIFPLGNNDD